MATLRQQCPWDSKQTHVSLRRHLLEETYEVLEVLDRLDCERDPGISGGADSNGRESDYRDLQEELGDLLFQVVFHSRLAQEAGQFDLASVMRGVHDKLVLRHPQIFDPQSTDRQHLGWEQAKRAEKGNSSVMDGIPSSLPALVLASKVISKSNEVACQLVDELLEMSAGKSGDLQNSAGIAIDEATLGQDLLALVARGRLNGIDAESALRSAANELAFQARLLELANEAP